MKLLDHPEGSKATRVAVCHEIKRRLSRFFHRNLVIAFERWKSNGTFSDEDFVGDLNEAHTNEIIDYYQLLTQQSCDVGSSFVAYGESEDETVIQPTDLTFTEKLSVTFPIITDTYYRIDHTWELQVYPSQSTHVECTIDIDGSGQSQINFCSIYQHDSADPSVYDLSSGFKLYPGTLTGLSCTVRINYRKPFGGSIGKIRRARILVTRQN